MPMRRDQPTKNELSDTRVGYEVWVCLFEFKILRVIRVLSVQIASRGTNCLNCIGINVFPQIGSYAHACRSLLNVWS